MSRAIHSKIPKFKAKALLRITSIGLTNVNARIEYWARAQLTDLSAKGVSNPFDAHNKF